MSEMENRIQNETHDSTDEMLHGFCLIFVYINNEIAGYSLKANIFICYRLNTI